MARSPATTGMPDRTVLGLDLGTSAVKLVALNSAGSVIAASSAAFVTDCRLPNQAEQQCADWLSATAAAFRELAPPLAEVHGPGWRASISAIGLTGQLPTLVVVGPSGPLGPAITWKDGRADEWVRSGLDPEDRKRIYEITGMPVDGRYLGPMWSYHYAGRGARPSWLLSAKDYLGLALTGAIATDPSTAAGYGAFDLDRCSFDDALIARWRLPKEALPPVRAAEDRLAPLSDEGAALTGLVPGVPVIVGAADSVCSAYAMAGLTEGATCITMGSSTVILDSVPEARRDASQRYLLTPHVASGWFAREMDLLATGTGYDWLSRLLGMPAGGVDAAAARSEAGARGLTFAPYLGGGEQGALWDSTLTGRIDGLALNHGAADLARAFLEGVCFEIRRCLAVLEETARPAALLVSGHVVDQPTTLQLLADALERPVTPVRSLSPAATGAALIARHATGLGPLAQRPEAGAKIVAPGATSATYAGLYRRYLERSKQ